MPILKIDTKAQLQKKIKALVVTNGNMLEPGLGDAAADALKDDIDKWAAEVYAHNKETQQVLDEIVKVLEEWVPANLDKLQA